VNMNYENDARHEVTERALNKLKSVMLKQDYYGIEKYNTPLKHSGNYNWLEMFLEEMADGLKYIQCEIDRKTYVIDLLEAGMRSNDPKEYIEIALQLLTVRGTGK
jgi:hypothetical protein